MTTLRISELANEGNVHLETIRYYEREGLMRPPQRTPSGHRAYAPDDVIRLRVQGTSPFARCSKCPHSGNARTLRCFPWRWASNQLYQVP